MWKRAFCFSALLFAVSVNASVAAKRATKKTLPVKAKEYVNSARSAYEHGDYAGAARAYEAIPSTEPEFLRTREELAWSYLRGENWNRLRGILPHLNSKLVPLRWRLEGRVLSAMLYLRDCQYNEVKNEIEMFQDELLPLTRKMEKFSRTGRNAGYWQALRAEINEAVFKMKFVKVELRSRLVLLSREQMIEGKPSNNNSAAVRVAAGAQVYPVDKEFWSDELFKATGEGRSSCVDVHKAASNRVSR